MSDEGTTETVDSTASATVESTEANTETQPTQDSGQSEGVETTATEQSLQEAYEKATNRKWKAEEGQPEEDDEPAKPEKVEAKSEPTKLELSEKAKKQLNDLGLSEDKALAEAIRAFERGRFDEEEIERRLNKDHAKFIEYGLDLARQQKEVDSLFGRIGQLEKKPASQEAPSDGKTQEKQPLPIPDDIKGEIDKILEPLAKDELFVDAVPALGMMATTLANHYEAKYQKQREEIVSINEKFQEEFKSLNYMKVDLAIEKSRASLMAEKYPQLKDKASHDKVLDMYDTFAASGRYNDKTPDQVYEAAADSVLGKEQASSFADAMAKRYFDRKKSQPTLPTNKAQSVAAMSEDEKQRLVYNKIKRQSRQ